MIAETSILEDGSLLSRHLQPPAIEQTSFSPQPQTLDDLIASPFFNEQHSYVKRGFLRRPPTPPPRKPSNILGGKVDRINPAPSIQGYKSKDPSDSFSRFLLNGCTVETGRLHSSFDGRRLLSRRAATPPAAWWGSGATREDSESSDSSVSFYRQVAKNLQPKAKTPSPVLLRSKLKEESRPTENCNNTRVGSSLTASKPPSGNANRRRATVTKSLILEDSRSWKNDWIDTPPQPSPSPLTRSSRDVPVDCKDTVEKDLDCLAEPKAAQNEEDFSARNGSPDAEESFSSSSSNDAAQHVHLRRRPFLAKGRRSQCKSAPFPFPDQCSPWPPIGYHWMPPADCHGGYHGYCYGSWVNVMTEQVDILTDKVRELESLLEEKKMHLNHTEDLLQQEMLSRSAVESSKLELMTEMSNLRLRLSATERDRKDSEERCRKVESELVLLHARLAEKEAELASLRTKITCNGISSPPSELNTEVERLKKALESVMAANDEKDKKIEDLRTALNKYKKLQDLVFSGQIRRVDSSPRESPVTQRVPSHDSLLPPSPGTEASKKLLSSEPKVIDKPPPFPRPSAPSSSTPVSSGDASPFSWREGSISRYSPSPCSATSDILQFSKTSSPVFRANSAENVSSSQEKTSPRSQFGTLPWQHGAKVLQQLHQQLQQQESLSPLTPSTSPSAEVTPCSESTNTTSQQQQSQSFQNLNHPSLGQFRPPRSKSTGVSFGKGFFRLKLGKRSSSAPELAQEECVIPVTEMDSSPSAMSLPIGSQPPTPKPETKDKNKGLKKIFGKWKKSGPHGVEKEEDHFKRGGIRATAGPRLGWSRDITSDPDIPFERWDKDMVAQWLHRMGLNMYVSECKRWVKNGEHLLKAKHHDIEKELGIKNGLHYKKLHLALQTFLPEGSTLPKSVCNLDFQWVLRWLDDVGLPQYKDAFFDARVDGRVLHFLTVEDLFSLKVTNLLHHISIKRGIQILRERNFDPLCLIRRSVPEESKIYTVHEVALWTNHRVMEWLRTVDLSEYAPNLRGSGVHGALMVYEDRFNADFLATLLNIPPTKTLLRRHLTTHFKEVIGAEVMQRKRDCESQQNYTPLTPSTKVKVIRKGQFGLKKKRGKCELEYEDFVCPMDITISGPDKEKTVLRRSSDPPSLSEPDSTTLLQDKEALSKMASTNV